MLRVLFAFLVVLACAPSHARAQVAVQTYALPSGGGFPHDVAVGPHVEQRGSNITQERLRFDFSHGAKMTPEEIKKTEDMVNEQIAKDYPVRFEMLTVDDAKKAGAIGLFDDKYALLGNKVKVYMVGDDKRGYFSKEICGGPHVEHVGMVGRFKILKEEASSAGIRRIKAVVE